MKKVNNVVKWILVLVAVLLIWMYFGNGGSEEGIFEDDERGEPAICTQDALKCDDGSFVERDPYNNCVFFECPGA